MDLANQDISISTYIIIGGTLTAQNAEQITVGGNWDNSAAGVPCGGSGIAATGGDLRNPRTQRRRVKPYVC